MGYILFIFVAMAPQLLQNSIFIQTPIFKEQLHEGYFNILFIIILINKRK